MSPCINDDTLWLHAGPAHFVAVGSTETVASGQLGFALVTSYLSRPIVLQMPSPGSGGSPQNVINDQVNGTFLWSYGATDRLELDVALPITFGQGGTGLAPITGGLASTTRPCATCASASLTPWFHTCGSQPDVPIDSLLARTTPGATQWGLVARFEMSAPTGDHNQFAGERSGVYIPSLAARFPARAVVRAASRLGARVRPITELLGARVGTQIVTMLGVGYDILPRELLAATRRGLGASDARRARAPDRATLSFPPSGRSPRGRTRCVAADLAIQLGGGSAIPFGGRNGDHAARASASRSAIRWEPHVARHRRRRSARRRPTSARRLRARHRRRLSLHVQGPGVREKP